MFNVSQHLASLTVNDGAIAQLAAGSGGRFLQTGALSIISSGALDLNDNDLIVNAGAYTDVRAKVLSGFGSPTGGITSSTSNGTQILALFDNALIGATEWPPGSGNVVPAGAVIGKYTYFGDVNFDGQVTGDDYTIIDSNLNTTPVAGLEWLSGDANLDGIVTGDDYTVIDSNLNQGASNPLSPASLMAASLGRDAGSQMVSPDAHLSFLAASAISAVPEPTSAAALILAAGVLASRRRKPVATRTMTRR
jgi:hypothetical protein